MFNTLKRKLLVAFLAALAYAGLSARGIQGADRFFRQDNPNFGLTPSICYLLADVSYWTFRYDLAIKLIDKNITDFPYESGRKNAELKRAACYEKMEDYPRAIQLYEQFLLDHPKDRRYDSVEDTLAKLRYYYRTSQL